MLESHNAVLCLSMGKKLYYFFLFLPNVNLKQFQKVFKCPQRNTTTEEVYTFTEFHVKFALNMCSRILGPYGPDFLKLTR